MSGRSQREKTVMAVVGVVVLYALAVAAWFFYADEAWHKARRRYDDAAKTCVKEKRLIGEKAKWEEAYETEKAQMPTFDEGRSTDTAWFRKLEEIAQRNLVQLGQHHASEEVDVDDVKELPIVVTGCEASLEALVKFMHELENGDDGMFSFSQLRVKPSRKPGYMSVDFTLHCAYMRDK